MRVLGACEGPLGETSFGACAVRAQLAYDCNANPTLRPAGEADELWSCLSTVRSCTDVDQCIFTQGAVESCVASPSGNFTACGAANAGVRITCGSPTPGRATSVEPCALLGKTCTRTSDSGASCSGALRSSCATSTCSGTNAVDCQLRGQTTFDEGLDVSAACAVRPASCTGDDTCINTTITSCGRGATHTFDCATAGLHGCTVVGGKAACVP